MLKLPLIPTGTYDFYVDWGDDTHEQITHYDNASHIYLSSGIYKVRITGTIKGWQASDTPEYQLIDICQWGCLKLGNKGSYFQGCQKLQITATDAPDLSETTNLYGMFSLCYEFNSPIGHWDMSNITNMSNMFRCAISFNQDISKWNVSKVANMNEMFYSAYNFNQSIGLWDVSKVTDMRSMFRLAISFNQSITYWNVSRVKNMSGMFRFATSFNQSLERWNVSNVDNMSSMFEYASSFNQDISMWHISNSTNMFIMLGNAISFNNINKSKLLNWRVKSQQIGSHIYGFCEGIV